MFHATQLWWIYLYDREIPFFTYHLLVRLFVEFAWFLLSMLSSSLVSVVLFTGLNMLKHCSYLRRSLEWQTPKVVGFELISSLVMALISWQLFSACQRPTWRDIHISANFACSLKLLRMLPDTSEELRWFSELWTTTLLGVRSQNILHRTSVVT